MSMAENAVPPPAVRRAPMQFRVGVLAAIGLMVFLVGWIVLRDDGGPATQTPASPSGAQLVSESELASFAGGLGHPVYWAGSRSGMSFELTRTGDGRVYVRYLPEGVDPADPRPRFLTVGTYPRVTAWAELQRAARAKDAVSVRLDRGGLMVFSETRPTSVYVGYPSAKYQVEVYHPSADVARRLVLAGQVRPVR